MLFVLAEKKQEEEEAPCSEDRSVEVVLTPDSDESSPKTPPPADQDSPGGCEPARRGAAPFKAEEPQGVREQRQHQQQEVVIKIEVSRSQELRGKDMPDNYSWSYKRYGDRVDDP